MSARVCSRLTGASTALCIGILPMVCAEVIRYLYRARYPFVMPVVRHGRAANDPRGPSGTPIFAITKCSGWYTYPLTTADKQTATPSALTRIIRAIVMRPRQR
jgi:hypothetical protein